MSYSEFAGFYDRLQAGVDYDGYAEKVLKLFEEYDKKPALLLDLACGTGGFTLPFLRSGIDVIGVDPSPEMLDIARQKALSEGFSPLFLMQSAETLDLYGTVDGAVCMLDSLNHIIDYDDFSEAVRRTALFLEPGRLFIFDLNTEYKHKCVLSGNTFTVENEGVFCAWSNSECDENGIVDICLDVFSKQDDGSYQRSTEEFSERAYTENQVKEALTAAGLLTVAVKSLEKKENGDAERLVYITKKK